MTDARPPLSEVYIQSLREVCEKCAFTEPHPAARMGFSYHDHKLRCTLDEGTGHRHNRKECCADECWCFRAPLKILGNGGGLISHCPHPLCVVWGMHPVAECPVFTDPDGSRHPVAAVYPKMGKPFETGASARKPLPKEEGGKME